MRLLLLVGGVVVLYLLFRDIGKAASSPGTADAGPGLDSSGFNAGLAGIADAMAHFEGYYQDGSLAERTNNPGDINTFGGNVSSYPTASAGWDALNTWITSHISANPDWDFYDMIHYYLTGSTTGTGGPNQDPDAYAEYVANSVGVDPTTPVIGVIGG